jgi:hypothetical protein
VVNSFHPSAQQNAQQYLNIELDVERRIQALVAKDRIRIKEFFIDFDKLRKGYVGEAGFRTCIGTLNFKLEESELKQLIQKYREPNGLINYSAFCANIDSIFSNEANPDSRSSAKFSEAEK